MAYIVVPTILQLNEEFGRTGIEASFHPQRADFWITGEPTEVIKNHPNVLNFYNGQESQLAIKDLANFCRELQGWTNLNPDKSRFFHVGPFVLNFIPPEQSEPSLLRKAFAYLKGEDITQYFHDEDHMTVHDFLDSVLLETNRSFVVTEKPLMVEQHPQPK